MLDELDADILKTEYFLNVRIPNLLIRNNINTMRELLDANLEALFSSARCGRKTKSEISRVVRSVKILLYGRSLAEALKDQTRMKPEISQMTLVDSECYSNDSIHLTWTNAPDSIIGAFTLHTSEESQSCTFSKKQPLTGFT